MKGLERKSYKKTVDILSFEFLNALFLLGFKTFYSKVTTASYCTSVCRCDNQYMATSGRGHFSLQRRQLHMLGIKIMTYRLVVQVLPY